MKHADVARLFTRRDLGRLMLAAPAAAVLRPRGVSAGQRSRPDSKVAGVQIGLNVPYNFGTRTMSADKTLAKTLQLGVNAVELRSQPVELAMGAPLSALEPARGAQA